MLCSALADWTLELQAGNKFSVSGGPIWNLPDLETLNSYVLTMIQGD